MRVESKWIQRLTSQEPAGAAVLGLGEVPHFDERLDRYEALLGCPDADLFDWITGRAAPPPEYDTDVTRLLLAFRYTPRAT